MTTIEIKNTKIHIVDDDPSVRRALKRLLKPLTAGVETSASAEEFLQSFNPAEPICLIMDIYMEGMSGVELYHSLLKMGYRIPTVFITAQDDQWIKEEVDKLTNTDLLRKPFDDQALFEAIQKVII
jgi:FixJ family two-component response regulator